MSVALTYPNLECEILSIGIEQYIYYDDGVTEWRKGVRDGALVYDKAITALGFNGSEDTDWIEVNIIM